MDKASALQAERSQNSNNSTAEVNEQIFREVMGKEHNGRVRGLGLGPTPRSYFGATSYNVAEKWNGSTSSSQSNEVAILKESLQEMTSKYEEVNKKYEVLSTNHEGVSQTLLALANFVSEKFPGNFGCQHKRTKIRLVIMVAVEMCNMMLHHIQVMVLIAMKLDISLVMFATYSLVLFSYLLLLFIILKLINVFAIAGYIYRDQLIDISSVFLTIIRFFFSVDANSERRQFLALFVYGNDVAQDKLRPREGNGLKATRHEECLFFMTKLYSVNFYFEHIYYS
ncbi:uncharacterized protein LOC126680406 isoform X2 [Mercurialis annua]|uniref:uncharacterized protein LOC126680406 isoform X2 n=1 Tax=Mercurialis annua TaxID=3986 RepID=UPI0024AE378D|nr:uncharacterized protein LOC126680406 isoform X2 [Mercurialis annua]